MLRHLLDIFDHYLELSGLVTAAHVPVEMFQRVFFLDGFDLFLEGELVSMLAQLPGYLVDFDFARCGGLVLECLRSRGSGT